MKRLLGYVLILCLTCTLVPSAVFAEDTVMDYSELITYEKPGIYDYVIDEDPMQISDEKFFGIWDNEAEEWISQPYFRYDEFPEMIGVKEAVQGGDYDLAKEELLTYYRSVRDERYIPVSSVSKNDKIRTEALEKNVYCVSGMNGKIQGFINVDNEWSEQRIDVIDSFGKTVIGRDAFRGFVLMSVDKHKTQAEFYSRESENPPVLELVVNGLPIRYEACKDAMVRGGAYGTTNYGSEPVMTVQESGQYMNFNSDTKRAYIAFDISNLKNTDVVTSATLVLHGRNASGTGEKEICVYRLNDMSFDETTIAFDDYTDCMLWSCNDLNSWDYVTSNNASIKGKACFFHRGNELLVPAMLYDYTGNERYAYTFIRQHMALVNSVGFNTAVFNALDISCHLDFATESVLYVLPSEHMTGERFTAMLKTFWLMADQQANKYYGTADNNWGSFATKGVYAFLARFKEVAVYNDWFDITKNENDRLTSKFTYSDGMSIELAGGYTSTIIATLYEPYAIQNQTGMAVPYSDQVKGVAHNLLQSLIFCSSPGFKGYNIADGNDYTTGWASTIKEWYSMVFTDDPMFEYISTAGVSGAIPENPTTNYPVGLRTFMRSSWENDALSMAFINTNHSTGSHGHYDHLSIAMFAYGRYLLTDQAYGAALTGNTIDYMSSAPQHNLVTVNNSDHNKVHDTKEIAYESNDIYDFIEYGGYYTQDVAQQRNVLFIRNQKFWIVGDYASPDNQNVENSYEQNWHMLPSSNMSYDEETFEVRSNFEDYNVNVVPVGTDGMTAYYEDTLFSPTSGTFEESKKTVLKKIATGNVIYNTIILPRDVNEDFEVESEVIDTGLDPTVVNAFVARIKNTLTGDENYYYYYHLNDLEQKQKVNVGQFATDATTMLIETDVDSNITSTFLMDATILEDMTLPEKVLFKSNTPIESIAYEKNGQIFNVYSSTITDEKMNDVTIYAPGQFNVRLEGTFIDGKKSGQYLYFGEQPIIEGTEDEDTEKDKPEENDKSHGSSGNSGGGGGYSGGLGYGGSANPPVKEESEIKPEENDNDVTEAPVFPELEGHWGAQQIMALYNDGIITGDKEGIRLKDTISRAEFVTLIVRAIGLEIKEYEGEFNDVGSYDWYSDYISTAFDAGLINGSDGMFRPTDTITREEICKIIASATDVETEIKELEFSDNDKISNWAKDSVQKAYSLGIVNGMGDGSFAPKSNALREQAFVMIARFIELNK